MATGRVIVAVSGGVDSAVAALRLKQAGYEVEALHMTNWEDDDGYCTAAEDSQDARRVCAALDIALHRVNFAEEYRQQVFADFIRELQRARTPNPDIVCNRIIKFGVFRKYAKRLGADALATGHYARVKTTGNSVRLLKATDRNKDQSYFLHEVSASQLEDVLFPLGELNKDQVRRIARGAGLSVADKKDSTGICFIGERPFEDFLRQHLRGDPGDIVDERGRIIGQHRGLPYYTVGQRQGLGIGGRANAAESPWYVAEKDLVRNRLVVVQGHDHPRLFCNGLETSRPHWVGDSPVIEDGFRCAAKIRYRQPDQACQLFPTASGLRVAFEQPQRAVTPGQSAVFYRGDECLGGAVIEAAVDHGDGASLAAAS